MADTTYKGNAHGLNEHVRNTRHCVYMELNNPITALQHITSSCALSSISLEVCEAGWN